MIPMVDLSRQYAAIKGEIDDAVGNVLQSSQFILGPNVSALEKEIAADLETEHAVAVASGTDALILALRACQIGPGDEVITTPFTFIATAEAICHLGGIPVFADVEADTFNIDPDDIERKISPKTKAILPVHLFGHPAAMGPIREIARKHTLRIIEDCAQAYGAGYDGRKVGTLGDCGCFSFFPSKNLSCCGDGGMIVTGDAETASQLRLLRNHGSAIRYHHQALGYNSRLDELQAAIVRIKLKRIAAYNDARRRNADLYRRYLTHPQVIVPREKADCFHVYHQFTLRSDRREEIMEALKSAGIASMVYYPVPLHRQEVFQTLPSKGLSLPKAERLAAEVLSLPMFPELTEPEIAQISHVINHIH